MAKKIGLTEPSNFVFRSSSDDASSKSSFSPDGEDCSETNDGGIDNIFMTNSFWKKNFVYFDQFKKIFFV